jgi:hypothetical protein
MRNNESFKLKIAILELVQRPCNPGTTLLFVRLPQSSCARIYGVVLSSSCAMLDPWVYEREAVRDVRYQLSKRQTSEIH